MSVYTINTVRDVMVRGVMCSRFPLLVRRDNGEALANVMRYLMHLYARNTSVGTLNTYAGHLRDLHEQLHADGRSPQDVSADYLNAYRAMLVNRASKPYAAQVLGTTLSFLLYLEDRGTICGVIGEGGSSAIIISRSRKGGISHPLMKGAGSPKSNYYPSDHAINAVKAFGPKASAQRERFEIMIDWCHIKGLRACEVCGLELRQMPDEPSVLRALEEGRCIEIKLRVTKGSKPRNVTVHPILLARTMKWIELGRKAILRDSERRASSEGAAHKASPLIFLSGTTGRAITPRAFSNSVRKAWREAVEAGLLTRAERVWVHGMRKRMINREMDSRQENGERKQEHLLRQETGHASLDSLGRYVVETA